MKKTILLLLICVITQTLTAQNLNGLKMSSKVNNSQKIKTQRLSYQVLDADLPMSTSLKKYVPNIGNQGDHGTCVGWSTGYYAMSILKSISQNETNKTIITKNALSPIYAYVKAREHDPEDNDLPTDYNCDEGTYIPYALEAIKRQGIPLMSDINVSCAQNIRNDVRSSFNLKDFNRLVSDNLTVNQKITTIKTALANKRPVLIGMGLDSRIINANDIYKPDGTKGVIGFHAMAIIGYNDDKYNGAFQIVNSWGKGKHNKGYFWIEYKDLFAKDGKCYNARTSRQYSDCGVRVYEPVPYASAENKATKVNVNSSLVYTIGKEEIKLKGNFIDAKLYGNIIREEDQSIKIYKTVENLEENTRYKIKLNIDKPVYVYVLALDSNNKSNIIFPDLDNNESALLSNVSEEIILPAPRISFKLVGTVKSDNTIIIFSGKELRIEQIISAIKSSPEKTLSDKIYDVIGTNLVEKNQFNLLGNKLKGSIDLASDNLACAIIQIDRK